MSSEQDKLERIKHLHRPCKLSRRRQILMMLARNPLGMYNEICLVCRVPHPCQTAKIINESE